MGIRFLDRGAQKISQGSIDVESAWVSLLYIKYRLCSIINEPTCQEAGRRLQTMHGFLELLKLIILYLIVKNLSK